VGGRGPAMDEPPVNQGHASLSVPGDLSFVLTLDPGTGVRASRGRVLPPAARTSRATRATPPMSSTALRC
jgi:hypothetical protein